MLKLYTSFSSANATKIPNYLSFNLLVLNFGNLGNLNLLLATLRGLVLNIGVLGFCFTLAIRDTKKARPN